MNLLICVLYSDPANSSDCVMSDGGLISGELNGGKIIVTVMA